MKKMKTSIRSGPVMLATVIGLSLLGGAASTRAAMLHLFESIATTDAGFFTNLGSPVINSSGTVVFSGVLAETGTAAVFTGGSGPLLVNIAGPANNLIAVTPGINDAGTVAFVGKGLYNGVNSVFVRQSGGSIVEVARENTTTDNGNNLITKLFHSPPAVNNGGAVAFVGEVNGRETNFFSPAPYNGIFTIASADNPVVALGKPEMNNHNVVAHLNGFDSGRRTLNISNVGIIADTNGVFADLGINYDINDAGSVLFKGDLDSGIKGLFTSSGAGATTVVNNTGPFTDFYNQAINSLPTPSVAFTGVLQGNTYGVFSGPNAIADKVLVTGDQLFGKTVATAGIVGGALNDSGMKAIWVGYTDGSEEIVRARRDSFFKVVDSGVLAQITTGEGSSAKMSQSFARSAENSTPFELTFDYRFLTRSGGLAVLLNGQPLQTVFAPRTLTRERMVARIPIDLSELFPRELPADFVLEFVFDGPSGSTVQIDNVLFPGLSNIDFETGYLERWNLDTSGGGAVAAVADQLSFAAVPEPPIWLLIGVGLFVLGFARPRSGRSAKSEWLLKQAV